MELQELKYRRGLLNPSEMKSHRRIFPSGHEWDVREVVSFLDKMGFSKEHRARFEKARVDGPTLLTMSGASLARLLDSSPNEYEANERSLELLEAHISQLQRRSLRGAAHDEL